MKLKYGKPVPKPRLKPAANAESETVLITESEKDATDLPDDIAAAIAYEEARLYVIRAALGLDVTQPAWFDRPAFSRITISSPAVLKPLAALNAGKAYGGQVKPLNFLLSAHVAPNGQPIGAAPDRFHLIAP